MPLERPLSCTYLLALFGGLFPPPPLSLLLISLFLFLLPYSYKYVYELTVRGSGAEERWNCWLIARFAVVVSAAVLQAQARRDRHHHPHHRFVLSLYSLTRDTLTHSFLRSPLHASLQPTANASLPPTSPSSHSFLHRSSSSLFCLRLVCRRYQVSMSRPSSTRTFRSPSGMLEDRTRSGLCGGIVSSPSSPLSPRIPPTRNVWDLELS
jgi:hypothetical protein